MENRLCALTVRQALQARRLAQSVPLDSRAPTSTRKSLALLERTHCPTRLRAQSARLEATARRRLLLPFPALQAHSPLEVPSRFARLVTRPLRPLTTRTRRTRRPVTFALLATCARTRTPTPCRARKATCRVLVRLSALRALPV